MMMVSTMCRAVLLCMACLPAALASDNGRAITPPRGARFTVRRLQPQRAALRLLLLWHLPRRTETAASQPATATTDRLRGSAMSRPASHLLRPPACTAIGMTEGSPCAA